MQQIKMVIAMQTAYIVLIARNHFRIQSASTKYSRPVQSNHTSGFKNVFTI